MEPVKRLEALINGVASMKTPLSPRVQVQEEDIGDIDASHADIRHYNDVSPSGAAVENAIDGSLRSIEGPTFRLYVAVGVAYTKDGILTVPWHKDIKHIAVQSDDENALMKLEDVALVKFKFGGKERLFKGDVPSDAVGKIVRELVEIALIKEVKGVTLVDGPLYYGIQGFEEIDLMRIEALWNKKAVAVVKRLETSKKICRAKEWLGKMGLQISDACNDMAIFTELGKRFIKSFRDVVIFGPFKQRFKTSTLSSPLDRFLWYVYGAGVLFRVEAFREKDGEEILPALLRNRVVPGLPYHIALVDKLAKEMSSKITYYLCKRLLERGVSLVYDSLKECYAR